MKFPQYFTAARWLALAAAVATAPPVHAGPPATAGASEPIEFLQWEAGTWDASITVTDPQKGTKQTFRGEQVDRLGACGLWLLTDLRILADGSGNAPPPFEGHGVLGYDPVRGKMVGMWADSKTDWLATAEGTLDHKTGVLSLLVSGRPEGGNAMARRFVTTRVADDRKRLDTYVVMPGGREMLVATIEYTRRADAPAGTAGR